MAYIYDPREVILNWGGIDDPITGFVNGTFINIDFTSPQWSITEGLDSNVAFSPKTSLGGTCTITLQQGSKGNQFLTAALSKQDRDIGNLVQGTLTIEDLSGTYNLAFVQAVIQNQPSVAYGTTSSQGAREWVFYSPNISYAAFINEPNRGESTLSQLSGAVRSFFG